MQREWILYIGQDEAEARLTNQALEVGGLAADMIVTRSGGEAATVLSDAYGRGRPPVAIVLDLDPDLMEHGSGLEALRTLRSLPGGRYLRVVGLADPESGLDFDATRELGVDHWISKPVALHDLAAHLGATLEAESGGLWSASGALPMRPSDRGTEILAIGPCPALRQAADVAGAMPGLRIVHAVSAEAAARLLLRHDFAVVLLGTDVPPTPGAQALVLAATGILRQHPSTSRTPILLVGEQPLAPEELQACRAQGSVDTVGSGPLDVEGLSARLDMLVSQHRAARDARQDAERLERRVRQRTAALGLEVEERSQSELILKRYVTHLETIAALTTALDRATQPEEALAAAVDLTQQAFGNDRVMLLSRTPQGWEVAAQSARHAAWRLPVGARVEEAEVAAILDAEPQVVCVLTSRLPREVGGLPLQARTAVVVRPAGGEPSILVIDQVQSAHGIQEDDTHLLWAIARRIADTLTLLQTHRELRDSERGLRALAEALPHLVWTAEAPPIDAHLGLDHAHAHAGARFVRVLSGWHDYTGLPPEECLGTGWLAVVHPDDLPRVQQWLTQAVRRAEPIAVQARLRRRDGTFRWHLGRLAPMADDRGQPARWFGTFTDIDDQKATEQALRDSRAAFRALVHSVQGIVWESDSAGACTFVSDQVQRMLGYPPERWTRTDRFWQTIIHPADKAAVNARLNVALDTHASNLDLEYRALCADGSVLHIHDYLTIVWDRPDGLATMRGLMVDVTAHRTARLRLQAQYDVSRLLADAESLETAGPRVAKAVGQGLEWDVAILWGLHGEVLTCAGVWHVHPDLAEFTASCQTLSFRTGEGLPGRVLQQDAMRWIDDWTRDPEVRQLPRFAAVLASGLRSSVTFPIAIGDRKLGVLEVFCSAPTRRDCDMADAVGSIARQIAQLLERRAAEHALRARDEQLRLVTDAVPALIAYIDLDDRYTFANRAHEAWFGESCDALCGRPVTELFAPSVCAQLSESLATSRSGFEVIHQGSLHFPAVGEQATRVHFVPHLTTDGSVLGTVVLAYDITEQQRAEAHIQRARDQLGGILRGVTDAILAFSEDDQPLFCNEAATQLMGFASAEALLTGRDWTVPHLDLFDEAGTRAPRDMALRASLPSDGTAKTFRIVDLNTATERWFDVRRSLVPMADSNASMNIIVLHDVTELKLAQQAVQESRDRLRLILDHLRDPIALFSVEPGPVYRVASCNAAGVEVSRLTPEQLLDQPMAQVLRADHAEFLAGHMQMCLASRAVVEVEWARGRSDRVHELRIVPVLQGTTCTHVLVVAHDLTERRRAELALKHSEAQFLQAQKMEAVGRLAGGVAHDFNNLLMAIRGYCELLLMGQRADSPARRHLGEIRASCVKAADLTSQLLAYSRKQVMTPKVTSMNRIILEMSREMKETVGDGIELQAHLADDLLPVRVDPLQMHQVLLRLVENARDAMPRGGRLTITTRNSQVPSSSGEGLSAMVVTSVQDTGEGMDEATQAQLFEPFYTTKAFGSRGPGLGLSTVDGTVQQSGGYVTVESQLGHGARFDVYLPAMQQVCEAPNPVREPDAALSRGDETILLAEDDASVRRLLVEVLTSAGYLVLEAEDGARALVTSEQHNAPIDLLLTDMVMPGMSGRELAERVRAARPGIPVLYVTGYTDDERVQHGVTEPWASLLSKPVSPADVTERVRNVLDAARHVVTPVAEWAEGVQ
jgi:two-component system cell cycle sensor histidine kinase/response regulator CckA